MLTYWSQQKAGLLVVYHDDAFSPGRAQIERAEDDHFMLRNIIQLCDVWIQTRSLRAQMTGEVRSFRRSNRLIS